ncbi:MAG: hypothetical protein ACK4GN_09805 [Runella sp.]
MKYLSRGRASRYQSHTATNRLEALKHISRGGASRYRRIVGASRYRGGILPR